MFLKHPCSSVEFSISYLCCGRVGMLVGDQTKVAIKLSKSNLPEPGTEQGDMKNLSTFSHILSKIFFKSKILKKIWIDF